MGSRRCQWWFRASVIRAEVFLLYLIMAFFTHFQEVFRSSLVEEGVEAARV